MSNRKKKVELLFVTEESVNYRSELNPNAEGESIAKRTRSTNKRGSNSASCTPSTKFKSRMSTPSLSRLQQNDSPVRTPRIRPSLRVVLNTLNETESNRKVSPIKISRRHLQRTPSITDDSSASEENTPLINFQRSPSSEEKVFKTPSKNNTPATKSGYNLRTPKPSKSSTPVAERKDTPKTRSVTRKQNLSRTTPSSARALFTENSVPKTPHTTRSRIKKQIQTKKLEEDDDLDSELDNEDHFSPHSSDEQNSEDDEESPTKKSTILGIDTSASTHSPAYNFREQKKINYHQLVKLNPDKYFEKKAQKKIFSNNALSALSTSNITESDVNDIVSKNYVKHREEVARLTEKHRQQFDKWLFYLKEGSNLIMYGLGSKLEILKLFHKEKLNQTPVLTVNGFHPGFTINQLFSVLMNDIFETTHCPANMNDALIAVKEKLETDDFQYVIIIINNIDGVALRGNKQQTILSKLAELPKIRIIASVDHINAPLLWGNNQMSAFNFLWLDVTTFDPYSVETSFENSLEIGKLCSDSTLVTLNKVFESAEPKSKEIFKLIVKNFLSNRNKKEFKGILLVELVRLAKKDLLVTSEFVLKTHLKYFVNHEIINMKGDYVQLLPNANVINMFYKQICSKDDDD